MSHPLCRQLVAATLVIGLHAPAATARAGGFSLNRFHPADDPAGFFSVSSPDVTGHHRLSVAVVSDYAHAPLVLRTAAGAEPQTEVVSAQLFLHATIAYAWWDRLSVSLAVPFAASNAGQGVSLAGGPGIAGPRGPALGDLSLGGRVRLFGEPRAPFSVGVGARLWLPSGQQDAYTGDGTARAALDLAVGGQSSFGLVWSVSGAVALRRRHELAGVVSDDELQVAAAVGYRLARDRLLLGPELVASLAPQSEASGGRNTPAQLLLSARYHPGPVFVGLSGGPGLGRAPGTPSLRLLASVGYSPRSRPVTPLGPPPPEALVLARPAFPPAPAGPAVPVAALPAVEDRDGDGILDPDDGCPREQGPRTEDPASNGCPSLVRVTERHIVTLKNVHFVSGIARLHPDASELLGQVAQVLKEHPEIRRLAIEGHTDGRGGATFNLELSEARARNVQQWLVEHGVSLRRLQARGFGASRPLQPDDSEDGRERNRRVEFRIVDPAPVDVSAAESGRP